MMFDPHEDNYEIIENEIEETVEAIKFPEFPYNLDCDEMTHILDRDGCEWFESPTWEIMDDEPEESRYRKAVVDCVVEMFGEV